ncbi:MAG: cytochrome c oxidase subunit 3 [Chloroflexi bacterium]|nr:cytochrome c oxidase subunit 3 [Chloroflexota bacterium]
MRHGVLLDDGLAHLARREWHRHADDGLLARIARLTAACHWGVEASIKYWPFVDVVWVFFYPILHLISV